MGQRLSMPDLRGVNRGLRILLIEDNEIDAEIIEDVLGCDARVEQTHRAIDAQDAIAKLERHGLPDLVITDLHLPDRSGVAVVEALRALEDAQGPRYSGPAARIPVVVLTDSDRAVDFHRATSADANSFVTKPSSIDAMKLILRGVIRAVIWNKDLPPLITSEADEVAPPAAAQPEHNAASDATRV